ncbi:PEP-CTERM system histidine kinase PrsK [Pacificimonas sp. WHA3]|uniref:histidine kinase n=1 Tax=Pacificimonas pallii TaxID=2827236 RepID=A0ABS6SDW8_9SPHN|nr:XrtA/PEP-CTERM system histidine kinase PrsK [Pacificimonas pallii]MBV7256614.1 PEP-CTERM system histidine kinase PrsK [Pacificimonas pallii]
MTAAEAVLSHWVAAAAFAVMAIVLVLRPRGAAPRWLALAAIVMAIWGAVFANAAATGVNFALTVSLGETLRSGVWILFIAMLMQTSWQGQDQNPSRVVLRVMLLIVAAQLTLDIGLIMGAGFSRVLDFMSALFRVAVAIGGLVLTHNLYVSSAPANRWSLNILCIGLAGIFGYDLNLFTLSMLDASLEDQFLDARGFANALTVPLFLVAALRNRSLALQLSRQAAFQTFALGAVGIYLVGMSLAAYALGALGGDWGRLFQIVLVFGAILLGAVVMFSGRARAWLRVKINKHFFAYKYDYREEWLRFIATVSRSGPGFGELPVRVIEAVASIVDSPGGALYVRDDDGVFQPESRWNLRSLDLAPLAPGAELLNDMEANARIIECDGADGLPPEISGNPRCWLLVPLGHVEALSAIILLERSRSKREMDWEDYDILRTVGRQAASYIAEQNALESLEESRKFEEFNRRFAFIMHDIKNLVSQLSLVARNAERHADKPEFRADMVATLQSSVGKMNDMLARLSQETAKDKPSDRFDLRALLEEIATDKNRGGANVRLDAEAYPLEIAGTRAKMEQGIGHLVQNAIDASIPGAPVDLRLRNEAGAIKLIVEDRGSGMSAEFIRDGLFKPFRSTKAAGFGIGAYESREIIRGAGGRLDVHSAEGEGTSFIIHFPVSPARQE